MSTLRSRGLFIYFVDLTLSLDLFRWTRELPIDLKWSHGRYREESDEHRSKYVFLGVFSELFNLLRIFSRDRSRTVEQSETSYNR